MKTAMEEHFEWLQENQLYFGIPIEAIDNAEDLLEKEKEQIIQAYINGYGVSFIDGDNRNFSRPQEYYNQTYNQNKS
jgi:hypothetical protein